MNLRKATLIACVMMLPQSLLAVYDLLSRWEHIPAHWNSVTVGLVYFLLGVSLPTLLVLLYASGVALPVSRNGRYLAAVLALIQGGRILYSFPSIWNRNIHRNWQNVERATNYVRDLGWWTWFEIPEIQGLVWDALNLLVSIAFLLFLVALAAADGGPPGRIRPRAVQAARFIAVFDVLLAVSWNLFVGIMIGFQSINGTFQAETHFLRHLVLDLPAMIAPLIVYAGLRTYQRTTDSPMADV